MEEKTLKTEPADRKPLHPTVTDDDLIRAFDGYKSNAAHIDQFWLVVLAFIYNRLYRIESGAEFRDIGTSETAEDFLHEAALHVWQALPAFTGTGIDFVKFVSKVAKLRTHEFIEMLVEAKNKRAALEADVNADDLFTDGYGSYTEQATAITDMTLLPTRPQDYFPPADPHLRKLPDSWKVADQRDRRIVALCAEGLTWREIGEEMGTSESAVKSKYHRMRKRVAEFIATGPRLAPALHPFTGRRLPSALRKEVVGKLAATGIQINRSGERVVDQSDSLIERIDTQMAALRRARLRLARRCALNLIEACAA